MQHLPHRRLRRSRIGQGLVGRDLMKRIRQRDRYSGGVRRHRCTQDRSGSGWGQDQNRAGGRQHLQLRQRIGPSRLRGQDQQRRCTVENNRHPAPQFRRCSMDQPKPASGLIGRGGGLSLHRPRCRACADKNPLIGSREIFGTKRTKFCHYCPSSLKSSRRQMTPRYVRPYR